MNIKELDVIKYRQDFPVLDQLVNGNPLVYLDTAASAQKPKKVIDAMMSFDSHDFANVHRGVHSLSERADEAFEGARDKLKTFINASKREEIIFVRNTTEAINLVANTYGRMHFKKDDEIVITQLEHHANIVPWLMLKKELGINLKVVPVNDAGDISLEDYRQCLTSKTKLVALTHISNAIGTILPIKQMISDAHEKDIPVLIDGAQSIPHMKIDVQDLDCDFFVFSGHKMFGPTGIGVLYGKKNILDTLPPYQGGGSMIRTVSFDEVTYANVPYRFEAGTPNITGTVGLGVAVDYLQSLDFNQIQLHEAALLEHANEALSKIDGLHIIGTAENKASIISFVMDSAHAHDIGTILDHHGVAVRSGHHCAMPLMERFGVAATTRASFAFYNTHQDIEQLIVALNKVNKVFK